MEEGQVQGVVSPAALDHEETPVLKEQVVEEILARLGRGASVQGLAAEYGIDRKTIRVWRARGGYQPRRPRYRPSLLEPHRDWLQGRAPEVEFNASVLTRELRERGYGGSAQQVLRFVRAAAGGGATAGGDRALREPAGPAGAGGFRPAPRVDWGRPGGRSCLRVHAGLFAAAVRDGRFRARWIVNWNAVES